MKANLANAEPAVLKHWESLGLYEQLRKKKQGKPKYLLHDGPPYANGHIHIGHAVNKILKDIIVKAKTLSGFDAPYVPGWDCHGLPIELNVEKKYGSVGNKLTAKAFRQACREYAQQQVFIQRDEFKRLGVVGDWEHPYLTMDFKFEANIIRALGKMISKGHLQQGFKPVHWCFNCSSALAEAEVEYVDKDSSAIDVRFRVFDETDFLNRLSAQGHGPVSIPIWTTTPWSLPANEAVALNSIVKYVLIQTDAERLLIAEPLLEATLARYKIKDYQRLVEVNGKLFEGILLQHPFYHRQVPVILGDHVTTETGTGAVHTAPAHGLEDYWLAQKYKLPLVNPVGDNGCFLPDTPLFAGEHVFKVNSLLIAMLEEKGNLLSEASIHHSYPHCWRHKTPLIFRATPQWFISMEQQGLRVDSLAAIEQVDWIPEWGQARIESMIEKRPDWCISRQRSWGVPIPLFVHQTSRELHPKSLVLLEEIAAQVEKKGIDAWYDLKREELLGPEEAKQYEKLTDCLDVWFDSGVSHYAVLMQNSELGWPADLYLEGSDQHRGWFQSSLLTAVAMFGKAPYKTVLTHGFTVDEKGRKMSKSLGNVVAPDKVIQRLGADILRLWVSSTDYRKEITVSDEILKRTAEAYRRIRNTVRFLLANLHDFDPATDCVPSSQLLSLDSWIIERAHFLQIEIIDAYEDYQFHSIYQKLHNFCINDLGGFYLDVIKDRQYTLQKESVPRRSAQTALFYIAEAVVRWLAPILSFTAEDIWQYLPGKREKTVFLNEWYLLPHSFANDSLEAIYQQWDRQAYWNLLIQIRSEVNKAIEKRRIAGELGSSLEAEVELYVKANSELFKLLSSLKDELRFVLITSDVKLLTLSFPEQIARVKINEEELGISVISTVGSKVKCVRCWHRRSDIGQDIEHPMLCQRCVDNLPGGKGEQRCYA